MTHIAHRRMHKAHIPPECAHLSLSPMFIDASNNLTAVAAKVNEHDRLCIEELTGLFVRLTYFIIQR